MHRKPQAPRPLDQVRAGCRGPRPRAHPSGRPIGRRLLLAAVIGFLAAAPAWSRERVPRIGPTKDVEGRIQCRCPGTGFQTFKGQPGDCQRLCGVAGPAAGSPSATPAGSGIPSTPNDMQLMQNMVDIMNSVIQSSSATPSVPSSGIEQDALDTRKSFESLVDAESVFSAANHRAADTMKTEDAVALRMKDSPDSSEAMPEGSKYLEALQMRLTRPDGSIILPPDPAPATPPMPVTPVAPAGAATASDVQAEIELFRRNVPSGYEKSRPPSSRTDKSMPRGRSDTSLDPSSTPPDP